MLDFQPQTCLLCGKASYTGLHVMGCLLCLHCERKLLRGQTVDLSRVRRLRFLRWYGSGLKAQDCTQSR